MAESCNLDSVLERLVAQGIVDPEKARMVSNLVSQQERRDKHALEIIASRNWYHQSSPEQPLTLDYLTDWLADEAGMTRFHFDPLKMDVGSCTSIMSYAYAARFNILPVKVTADEVTIAVSDPYNQEWLDEIRHIVKQPISMVLANPEQIRAYALEFYSISRAMDHAGQDRAAPSTNIQNLEQLIELGKTGKVEAEWKVEKGK